MKPWREKVERETDFTCSSCGVRRRVTLTGLGSGKSLEGAKAAAEHSAREVEVFLRCSACGHRPGRVVMHLVRELWVAVVVLGALAAPSLFLLQRPDDPNGKTVAMVMLSFFGVLAVAGVYLVIHNVRLAQRTQVRWH